LVVKPYIRDMSRSELFILMSCGMATVAGTVMALYASILSKVIPGALGHILVASIISTPAAIAISVLMVPGKGSTEGKLVPQTATSSMDAVTRGTVDGVQLLINIVAMLMVLVALVSLANQVLSLLPQVAGAPITLQRVLGIVMAPLVWIMGIPWSEATAAGALMGTKTVLNELLAYIDLAQLTAGTLASRSNLTTSSALCVFAK